jgi:hypothetical protein
MILASPVRGSVKKKIEERKEMTAGIEAHVCCID